MPRASGRIEPIGALVTIGVSATPRRVVELRKIGRKPASTTEFLGLIDTGASHTAIDPHVARQLALESTGFVSIHTPSTDSSQVERDSYDAMISLGVGKRGMVSVACEVVECQLAHHGFLVLVGRDVLSRCILTFDGPADRFLLDF